MGGGEKSGKKLQVDLPDIDISKPRYDDNNYLGRLRHFLGTTSVLNVFVTPTRLEKAKELVNNYQNGKLPSDAFKKVLEKELWRAKRLKESAYHPDSGERIWFFGRMSFQVPGNMVITGLMMTYYTRTRHVILLQALNQGYNAISFYNNRGAADPVTNKELATAFTVATGTATGAACALNYVIQNYKIGESLPKIVGRFVPLVAVAAAHSVNSPIMRWSELTRGIRVENDGGEEMGRSKTTARKAITETVVSRIGIAVVVMGLPPFVIDFMNRRKVFQTMVKSVKDYPNSDFKTCLPRFVMQFLKMRVIQMKEPVKVMESLVQVPLVGLSLAIGVPLFCAAFRQRGHIPVTKLEPDIRDHVGRVSPEMKTLYYNKGL